MSRTCSSTKLGIAKSELKVLMSDSSIQECKEWGFLYQQDSSSRLGKDCFLQLMRHPKSRPLLQGM